MGFSSKMVLRTEILPSRFLFWLQLHLIVPSEIQNLLGQCCNVLQRVATCCLIFQDPCPTGDVLSRKMCRISAAQAGPSSVPYDCYHRKTRINNDDIMMINISYISKTLPYTFRMIQARWTLGMCHYTLGC